MRIALYIFFFCFGLITCDIFRPKDHFGDINYEEDMGICRNLLNSLIFSIVGITGNNSNMTDYEKF